TAHQRTHVEIKAAVEHRLQPVARNVPVSVSIDGVAHLHVVSRHTLGNRARSASDPETPAHHFLPGADLCERAVPSGIEIDLERLGMGIDRFVFHGVRTEVYQESRRGDSYMFVKSEMCCGSRHCRHKADTSKRRR